MPLIMAWTVAWLTSTDVVPAARWVPRGLALAMLPWLHTKFVHALRRWSCALTVRLEAMAVSRNRSDESVAASVSAWLAFFHVIYGTFDPQAPYGPSLTDVGLSNIPRSCCGVARRSEIRAPGVHPDFRDGAAAYGSS